MTIASYRHYSGTAAELYQSFFVPSIATPVSAELLSTAALQPGSGRRVRLRARPAVGRRWCT